jgi:SAM-dependent methyltransferase
MHSSERWRARMEAWQKRLSFRKDVGVPHFVRDHRWMVRSLILRKGHAHGVRRAVGPEFTAFGKLEAALLRHVGLEDNHFIVDVGCGSGRLASVLVETPGIRYHGTDVVPELLAHARTIGNGRFKFTLVKGLTIPEQDEVADFVTFFSVATHLMHHETYTYLQEAKRVLKPGGRIVMSFLEILNPQHWKVFADTVEDAKFKNLPINAFIEAPVMQVWGDHLGLTVEHVFRSGAPFIPLSEPILFENGERREGMADLGQSVAVFRKPAAETEA